MRRVTPGNKPVFEDGVYLRLSMEDYHEDPAISKSGLVTFAEKSPLHYKVEREIGGKTSRSMDVGTLAHAMILQPDNIEAEAVRIPPEVLAKNGAKKGKKWEDWQSRYDESKIALIKPEDWQKAQDMAASILDDPEHEEAKELLTSGKSEVSIFYTWPGWTNGRDFRVKVRLDHIPWQGTLIDLKTTRDASLWGFGKQAKNLKYHWSAWLSTAVAEAVLGDRWIDYRFVVLENEPPYDVVIYQTPRAAFQEASFAIELHLDRYSKCLAENHWPGYECKTQMLYFARRF